MAHKYKKRLMKIDVMSLFEKFPVLTRAIVEAENLDVRYTLQLERLISEKMKNN
jgi:hypothetical protein